MPAAAALAAPEVLAAAEPTLEGLLGGGGSSGGASALGNAPSILNDIVNVLTGTSDQNSGDDTGGQIQI